MTNKRHASCHATVISLAAIAIMLAITHDASANDTTITACGDLSSPGSYSLADNLVSPDNTVCLRIHDTQNVNIDCQFHTITGRNAPIISVMNVQGFSIANCTLQTTFGLVFTGTNSSNGVLVANTIGNVADQQVVWVDFSNVNNTWIMSNTLTATFQQSYSSGNVVSFNTVTCPVWIDYVCSGVLISNRGANNTFDNNLLDGKGSLGPGGPRGSDDGIIITDENGDVISNNRILNTWDAGIETLGNITNMRIVSNSITNVPFGIGGWYWNSWTNVAVTNNIVDNAAYLYFLLRIYGLRPSNWDGQGAPADTGVYFQDNLFSGNVFNTGSFQGTYSAYLPIYQRLAYDNGVSGIPGERVAQPSDFYLTNNTFTMNNFGVISRAPVFTEPVLPGLIIDGGENTCAPPSGRTYPLDCGETAPQVTFTEYGLATSAFPLGGINQGPDGALWFAESGSNKIGRITAGGTTSEFVVPTSNACPEGVTAGPDGAIWFTEACAHKVGRITTGGVISEYTVPTPADLEQITVGSDGALWFTELTLDKIGRITTAGLVTEYALPSCCGNSPYGITGGPDGALWFTEINGSKVGRITTAGVITEYALSPQSQVRRITSGPDGALWFVESNGNKVGRITTAGVITEYAIPTPASAPGGIVVGPEGALWFTEGQANQIGRITPAGVITEYAIPTPGSWPIEIAVGPDGALWFTEEVAVQIGRAALANPVPAMTSR